MQQHRQPPRPAANATSFLDRFCSIVSVSSIPHDSQACPICSTQYRDPTAEDGPDSRGLAIQVHFGDCHHIFCTLCLRELVLGQEAWSNKCPLCRARWFRSIEDNERENMAGISLEIPSHVERQGGRRRDEPRAREPVRRQPTIIITTGARHTQVARASQAVGQQNATRQQQEWANRLAGPSEDMLAILDRALDEDTLDDDSESVSSGGTDEASDWESDWETDESDEEIDEESEWESDWESDAETHQHRNEGRSIPPQRARAPYRVPFEVQAVTSSSLRQ